MNWHEAASCLFDGIPLVLTLYVEVDTIDVRMK